MLLKFLAAVAFIAFSVPGQAQTKAPAPAASAAFVGSWYYAFGDGSWVAIKIMSVTPLSGEMDGLVWSPAAKALVRVTDSMATGDQPGGKGTRKVKAWLENGRLHIELPSGSTYSQLEVRGGKLVGKYNNVSNPSWSRDPIEFARQ
jgi:hypothetical protein